MIEDVNYIVSGLERSGTSLMMQLLEAGGVPVSYDDSRSKDEHNPKGYYELEGGKIIGRLIDKSFDFDPHKGKFIKITAYGLTYLPKGRYKIIFMTRDLTEVIKSREKMIGKKLKWTDEWNTLNSLTRNIIKRIHENPDVEEIYICDYNYLLKYTDDELDNLEEFVEILNKDKAKQVIDMKLYRNRNESSGEDVG